MTSDAELVRQTLAGDKAAFGRLIERHRMMAVRLAARTSGDAATVLKEKTASVFCRSE